ncbi:AAA family ATPase [Labilibaculum sp. K2S]|uniref:AAA family ATPase n=1 Tax=Labilibaculum sp. K2S TaxID=3056386 RepID=UPI0025A4C59A|nr:AAA family ATPase [Labilibaculum sp. K2S]MDM8160781.1 AAA family ATPase [Labilibaculum sp. K2S]
MKSDKEKNTTINSLPGLEVLNKHFEDYLNRLKQNLTTEGLSQLILKEFMEVSNFLITIGDQEYDKVRTGKNFDFSTIYSLHYLLPELFKDTMLIHRDVLLQLQISQNKKQESLVDDQAVQHHLKESKAILEKASQSFGQKISTELNPIQQADKKRRKLVSKVKHQQNPWEIYKNQFLTIQNQTKEIEKSAHILSDIILVFKDIKNHTQNICATLISELENSKQSISKVMDSVQNLDEIVKTADTISLIEDILDDLDSTNPGQETYAFDIELKIASLKENSIPVAGEDGLLLIKKIDFNKSAKKWLNYMLLPDMIELWQNKVNLVAFYKHSLLNLKSSLTLLKNNSTLETLPSQVQSIQNMLRSANANEKLQRKIIGQMQEKFSTEFFVTNIYNTEDFLKVSLQSSITQLTSSKNKFLTSAERKIHNILSFFSTKYEISTTDNPFKKLEAASKCIEYRTFKASNIHYDTLFLNKNFIGDLFLVPRETEKQKLQETLNLWKKGHNKAVLVVGNNLSGKSTFIESVAKDHFDKQSIVLETDSTISIEGRKFTTTKNLTEALQHIKKHTYNSRPLLVIDNLELWRDKNHSLLDNVKAAIEFVETESDQVFVIMTTSNAMQSHLDKRLPFSNSFSSIIDVNRAKNEEINKAILLRHGASHQSLVTEKGLPLLNKQLELYVQKLCKNYDYNMGEVLQAWTYAITTADDHKVVFQEKEYDFEDFFTSEEVIILKYVLLYKHINEIVLKNFLGNRYNISYKSGLKRLTNTKVFLRNPEGNLILNQVLYHNIREILKYRGALN